MPRVYLDACCLNRPFDDQRQARIRLESEAVVLILERIESGTDVLITSEVLEYEIRQIPDPERRRRVQMLIAQAKETVNFGEDEERRARQIEGMGFGTYDAAHIASAEVSNADVFLTTDDRLSRRSITQASRLRVRVLNPVVWLSEVNG
jgi:predicted nucleic acid-binding protein